MITADSKIVKLILQALALPFVLLMRILSPLVTVRICVFDLSRVGHVLPHFDMYISRCNAGFENSRSFDILCFNRGKVANYQVKKMVERVVPICPFAFWVDKVNKCIPGGEKHMVPQLSRSKWDLPVNTPPVLNFTQEELEEGHKQLEKLGVPKNLSFICFHAREATYLNKYQPQTNWEYHSYRNADINNYIPAIQRLVNKGYYAIRMGRFVSKKLKVSDPRIIDYATKNPTDFLDMYLGAHCRFFIAGSDGLAEIPMTFRRPFVWIDYIPFSTLYLVTNGQLFIPKKLWLVEQRRLLTFEEMLYTNVSKYCRTEDFRKAGIKIIDNPPEEILDVSIELEERLNGTWNETDEDKELQQRFRQIIGRNRRQFSGLIGANFLRQNKELLNLSHTARNAVFL